MPAKSLESIKPVLKDVHIKRHHDCIEVTTPISDKVTVLKPNSESYLHFLKMNLSIEEIVMQEHSCGRPVNFVLLKEILSKLYWQGHLTNEKEFARAIELAEGVPAGDSLLSDPLVDFDLDKTTNPILMIIPIILSMFVVKLFMGEELSSFFILFFPQMFMTTKGLLSLTISRLFFGNPEPVSIHFSLFGIYYQLTPGRRTPIGTAQFLLHFLILAALAALSIYYFRSSTDAIFNQFGPLLVALLSIVHLSPQHNTDLSNLRFKIQTDLRKRQGLAIKEDSQEKIARFVSFAVSLLYNLLSLVFCLFCIMNTVKWVTSKNYMLLIYQLIFDLAALVIFFDVVDQFEKTFSNRGWTPTRHFTSKLKARVKKHKSKKDMDALIRAIPIFEGLPEEVFKQMAQSSQVVTLKPGARVCKDGELTTDLYIVLEGQVGIYKKQSDGKPKKIIDINEGSIFGEGAFLLNRPRMGSAHCLKKTMLLVIPRPKAFAATDRTQEKNLSLFQKKIWGFQALTQSEFFKELPSEAVMNLVAKGEILNMPPDNVVIRQGAPSDSLWIIVQGQCKAMVDGKPVRDMNAKDVFGEIGLLWNTFRTSSVVVSAPSVLLKVTSEQVWKLMASNLNVAIALQELGESRLNTARPN